MRFIPVVVMITLREAERSLGLEELIGSDIQARPERIILRGE